MANRIATPVEAGALAVPNANDAVVLGVVERHGELAAHHGGGGKFFVDAGLDHDGEIGDRGGRTLQFFGVGADRGALVARCERSGGQAELAINTELIDCDTRHCLDPGHEHRARLGPKLVGQGIDGHPIAGGFRLGHFCSPRSQLPPLLYRVWRGCSRTRAARPGVGSPRPAVDAARQIWPMIGLSPASTGPSDGCGG